MQSKIMEILNNLENKESTIKIPIQDNILFKLPITYIDNKYQIHNCIKYDLELCNREKETHLKLKSSQEDNTYPSLYNYIFNPISEYANNVIPMWSEYYTTNINVLNDSKYLINNFKHIKSPNDIDLVKNIDTVTEILNEIKEETGFYEKYKYIDINFFNTLDNNELMLLVFGGIISLVPAYLFIILVHEYEISFLEPVLHSSAILLTAIIGSVIFNETFGIYKFIGIISVIIGIFLLSYEQK